MNTVGVAGLGLIGGSMAKAIRAKTDCRVLGYNRSANVVAAATEQGVIDDELTDATLAECDLVVVALYPGDVIAYCERGFRHMHPGAVVVDCAGVKTRICAELPPLAAQYGVRFVGGHPMAGTEQSGYGASFAELFDGAVMILCRDGILDADSVLDGGVLDRLSAFFRTLGFGGVKVTDASEHDAVVAYTSQLAHVVSGAYMRGETAKRRFGFSAGSFKDMTRVAKLSADMWTELFLENRDNLLRETDAFIENMRLCRDALAASDRDALRELLRRGTELKIMDENGEKLWQGTRT